MIFSKECILVIVYYFLIFTAIYILMGWSFYLPYQVGHLYFLPVSIMTISAYFTGVAAREWDWPFFLIIITGMAIGFFISYGVSLLISDAPCFSVVIVGLTLLFIIKTVIENWDWLGGSIGFFNIPTVDNLIIWTYILLAIMGYFIFCLEKSQTIREASAIFDSKELAASLGIRSKTITMFFHSFSGLLAGLSGVLYASVVGGVTIDFFGFGMIGTLMAILFVGGYKTMWGVVFSAPLLGGLPILLPDAFAVWKQVVYGGLLILIICFRPEGLVTRKEIYFLRNYFRNKSEKKLF